MYTGHWHTNLGNAVFRILSDTGSFTPHARQIENYDIKFFP